MTGNSQTNNSTLEIAQSNQDLLSNKKTRKKRTWIIAGVVCTIVICLIVAAIVLLTNGNELERTEKLTYEPAITLDDFLTGQFYASSFNATWVSGKELVYTDANYNLMLLNLDDQSKTVILPKSDAHEHYLSADRKYLMITNIIAKLYRYSFLARYTIIELATGGRTVLQIEDSQDLQLAKWAPVGNGIIAVFRNNIYYKESPVDQEVTITNDTNGIFNGIPDWVYEEEVFNSNQAVWFSPDGKKIAFVKFDDQQVPLMVLPIYGEPGNLLFQYPRANVVRYPKAGAPNPLVSLHAVDLSKPSTIINLDPPKELASKEPILSAVSWASNNIVSAIWMNRVQNESAFVSYKTNKSHNMKILHKMKQHGGWLELFTPLKFSKDGSVFVVIISSDQGNGIGGYKHLVMFDAVENAVPNALTSGKFVVKKILGWNEKENEIYYLANSAHDSAIQQLYSVSTVTKEMKCLSCGVTAPRTNTTCLYNSVVFSQDFSYYALDCEGPGVPATMIFSKNQRRVLEWENNDALNKLTRFKRVPKVKRFTFEVGDGFHAQVIMKIPPDLDTSGNTKYPMLIDVYGGPDSAQVTESFNLNWGSYLAANKSIIYASIDGRGAGLQGDKLLFAIYRNLGHSEIEDQINVTRQLQQTLPYIDASRTAIWGWSYGGYAAGMALARSKDVFKCGISVAPVTDWTLYDTIYTERFMGLPTPEDNLQGYIRAQLLSHSEGIRDKPYFLIHGTFDDNVHFQQSVLWSKVLEQGDILFRQMTYADQAHDLGAVRPHFYHSLENFLDECFIERGV